MGERSSERKRSFILFFFSLSLLQQARTTEFRGAEHKNGPVRQATSPQLFENAHNTTKCARVRSQREKRCGSGTGRRFRLLSFSATGDNSAPNSKYNGPRNTGARVERGGGEKEREKSFLRVYVY